MSATFPEDPEAWSEALVTEDGKWDITYSNNSIHLDRVYKQSGEACIAVSYDASGSARAVAAFFYFYMPQDLRKLKSFNILHLLQASVDGQPAFTGECQIVISTRKAPGYIYKDFGTIPGAYDAKSWDLRKDFALGINTKDIEEVLSEVRLIAIKAYVPEGVAFDGPFGQKMFIDRPYFTKDLGTLYVQSEPSGKPFTFDGRGFVTPHGFKGAVGDTHTVVMSGEDFEKWDNGSTDRTRIVTIPEGSAMIKAYYRGAPPPPPPPPVPEEAILALEVIAITVVSLLTAGAYWMKR